MNTTIKQPETLVEAIRYFSNPDVAMEFMVKMVWPDGVVCQHCGGAEHSFLKTRRIFKCKACRKQFSIKAGTIMEDSPLGLDVWLTAVWMIANAKNGISSYEIHRGLGITQKTAWFLLHRIRLAMKIGSFRKLAGTVEADEAYIGGKPSNYKREKLAQLKAEAKALKPGKPTNLRRVVKRAIVMGMLERGSEGKPSQVRVQMVEKVRRPHLSEIIHANVEKKSFLMTDSLPSYQRLGEEGFIHMAVNHAVRYAEGRIHTNGLENFWSLMKRTLLGTYVACEPFHLEAYLDEQTFRFNNRKDTDAARFVRVLQSISGKRLTYAQLIGETGGVPSSAIADGVAASVAH